MSKTLTIIDGHSQIFRAYYAPFRDLTSPTGEPTRATYVFCTMLLKLLAAKQPDYIAMAIDGPADRLHRRQVYSEYKATRKPVPEDFRPQEKRIFEIVRAMGIPILEAEGHEADDILATACRKLAGDDLDVVLVSRDKDLDQLVSDHVVLYDPMNDETFDAAAIEKKKGYTPDQAVEIQTLMGDSSDNIPGVPGVGPKTALQLIAEYGSADGVLQEARRRKDLPKKELTGKLKGKLLERILDADEAIDLSRRLVTLDRDVPVELPLDEMQYDPAQLAGVRKLFAELGFNRLFDQLADMGVPEADGSPVTTESRAVRRGRTCAADMTYRCVCTPDDLDEVVSELANVDALAIDTETTSPRPMWAELVGISLAWKPGEAVYIPVRSPLGESALDVQMVREALSGVLTSPDVRKIGHHLKYDLIVLREAGFEIAGPLADTMVAAYVLDSSRPTYKLDALAAEYLDHQCIPIEEVIGRGRKQTTMDAVPLEIVATYAAEDADVTFRLAEKLLGQLSDSELEPLYRDLEIPLLPVLTKMERDGVKVDPDRLREMEVELSKQADGLREQILQAAGVEFNVDSPKQLGEVLFEHLSLPVVKRTKTGPSTDSGVLEQLATDHPLPAMVLDYRKLTKLLSTYLRALAECIHPRTGRVHTSFHQSGTATGRLSSSDPNLQNIPVRTEQGRRIRSAFVAGDGCVLLSADYSQVELRVLADLCKDPTLQAAFADDQDIHRTVAAEVFGVPVGDVTPDQRARAKTVNFGIVYGQTAFGLSRTLRISRTEAAEFIRMYNERFPAIREFLDDCVAFAKEHGYVETLFGRRRTIPDIDSRNPSRRSASERLAINSVVQGSAADLIKKAMVDLATRIEAENRPSRMLLQIHDELVLEIPREHVDAEREMVVDCMTSAVELSVPLKVDVGIGENWMDAK